MFEVFVKWYPTLSLVLLALQRAADPKFPFPINLDPKWHAWLAFGVGATITALGVAFNDGTPSWQTVFAGVMSIATAIAVHNKVQRPSDAPVVPPNVAALFLIMGLAGFGMSGCAWLDKHEPQIAKVVVDGLACAASFDSLTPEEALKRCGLEAAPDLLVLLEDQRNGRAIARSEGMKDGMLEESRRRSEACGSGS